MNEADRQAAGVDAATHDAAFAWADDLDGAPPAGGPQPGGDAPFAVWPCNARTVGLFMRCQAQWLRNPMSGRPQRMDGAGVDRVLSLHVPGRRARRLEARRLQTMELAALEELSHE